MATKLSGNVSTIRPLFPESIVSEICLQRFTLNCGREARLSIADLFTPTSHNGSRE